MSATLTELKEPDSLDIALDIDIDMMPVDSDDQPMVTSISLCTPGRDPTQSLTCRHLACCRSIQCSDVIPVARGWVASTTVALKPPVTCQRD